MAADNVTFQVNFKTPRGTLINLYATDEAHLSTLLEALPTQAILEEESLLTAASNAAPLTQPQQTTAPQQQGYQQAAPAVRTSPTGESCFHGQYVWAEGISKKTGKPYKMWKCPQPGTDCKPSFA